MINLNYYKLIIPVISFFCLQCIAVKVVPGITTRHTNNACPDLDTPIPVQVKTTYKKSTAFSTAHRDIFDNTDIEREAKQNIDKYIRNQIQDSGVFKIQDSDGYKFEITLNLLTESDARLSDVEAAASCLSFATFLIYPMTRTHEDDFQIRVNHHGKMTSYKYDFGRITYMSWLMIPYNIFITPFSDNTGVILSEVDFSKALSDITPVFQDDLKALACRIKKEEKMQAILPDQ